MVIDSKAVRPGTIEASEEERTSQEFLNNPRNVREVVQKHDVLLNSTGRGTLGRASCWLRDEAAIADNHVAIIRPDFKKCYPVYLSLFLNSPPGLAQSEMYQTGPSGQLELYPSDVVKILVYLPTDQHGNVDLKWQERLAHMVLRSVRAKATARDKLHEAVALVESEIEAGHHEVTYR